MSEEQKPKPKRKRRMRKTTEAQSLRILKQVFKGQDDFLGINWENHRKVELDDTKKNMYRITIETLALEPILNLTEHERVKNVYWHPSYAPPGTGKDAIALRYRLYVEYV